MYRSLQELCEIATEQNKKLYEVVLEEDCHERGIPVDDGFAQVTKVYQAMKEADMEYDGSITSTSKLAGGDGEKLRQYRESGKSLCGDYVIGVMEKAVKMGESNACMKRIVASPTAGSCGVVPAVLLSLQERFSYSDEEMTKALLVAAGIGGVIATRAFIAGAAGGCQAEIGSASAMAAGAAAFLQGGDSDTICHAAAMALKNLLGLACDPVGGLVEVPCVKRNVIGALSALSATDMALAGVRSKIPPDEVIDAMRSIGVAMPACIKETGKDGLAMTPEGQKYVQ
ncbi:MAG: L-serine ammonia-lyase, iron-sulfur-dependent, subunit alpha [Lachnospiraceae bacterium]|nr:L-serine ammonia-lyase, iron-sulfur-dependent, subunit alpha [Lachnospiraceae bacterium]